MKSRSATEVATAMMHHLLDDVLSSASVEGGQSWEIMAGWPGPCLMEKGPESTTGRRQMTSVDAQIDFPFSASDDTMRGGGAAYI